MSKYLSPNATRKTKLTTKPLTTTQAPVVTKTTTQVLAEKRLATELGLVILIKVRKYFVFNLN